MMKYKTIVSFAVITLLYFTTNTIAQPRFPTIAPGAGLLNLRGSDTDKGPPEREFLCSDLRAFAFSERQDSLVRERDFGLAYSDFWADQAISDSRTYTSLIVDPITGKFSYNDSVGETHELGLWARKESRNLWARCLTHRASDDYNNLPEN
jgi:hypothetical protein